MQFEGPSDHDYLMAIELTQARPERFVLLPLAPPGGVGGDPGVGEGLDLGGGEVGFLSLIHI